MKLIHTILPIICFAAGALHANGTVPAFTEAVEISEGEVFAVAIGPGGPDIEFGLSDTNGGLYQLNNGEGFKQINLSDGEGLKNPTGLLEHNGQLVIVDGNQVISSSRTGEVKWRVTWDKQDVFFYDVDTIDQDTILVGDFGNGNLLKVDALSGDVEPYTPNGLVPGLARFAITQDGIYAISWGSDDAWDGSLYRIVKNNNEWQSELIATGFGNAESVAEVNNEIFVGGYRGHQAEPNAKLLRVQKDGSINPIKLGSESSGVSDILVKGNQVYLTYFKDSEYGVYPITELMTELQ